MDFDAVLEKRLLHWYVSVPALASGSPVPERAGAAATAAALVTAATGLPQADLRISVHVAPGVDAVVQRSPTVVEVRHTGGSWCSAQHVGWVRTWTGAWKALVCYSFEGALWERTVHASCIRRLDEPVDVAARASTSVVHTVPAGTGPH